MQVSDLSEPENNVSAKASSRRLLALDLGSKKVGVAISDELGITVRPLPPIQRRSWKDLLSNVAELVESHQAVGLVVGLPVRLDGTEGSGAHAAREIAEKFQRSLDVPVYVQNESLTSFEAKSHLKDAGCSEKEIAGRIDSEAAAIILRDFITSQQP